MVRRVFESAGYRVDRADHSVRGPHDEIAALTEPVLSGSEGSPRNDTPAAYMDPRDPRALVAAETVQDMGISARRGASALWRSGPAERASVTTGGLALLDPVSLGLLAAGGAALWGLHALWRARERHGLRAAIARNDIAALLPRTRGLQRHYGHLSPHEQHAIMGLPIGEALMAQEAVLTPLQLIRRVRDWGALDNVWALRVAAHLLSRLGGQELEVQTLMEHELRIREQISDHPCEIAMTRFNLARMLYDRDAVRALEALRPAVPIFRAAVQINRPVNLFRAHFPGVLGLYGWLQVQQGEREAEATLCEAIGLYPEGQRITNPHGIPLGMLVHSLIGLTEKREDFVAMRGYCERLRDYSEHDLAHPEFALFAWSGLLRVRLRLREYSGALEASTRAMALGASLGFDMAGQSALHGLALAYNQQLRDAAAQFEHAIDQLRNSAPANGVRDLDTLMQFLNELQLLRLREQRPRDVQAIAALILIITDALRDHPTYADVIRENLLIMPITNANGGLQ